MLVPTIENEKELLSSGVFVLTIENQEELYIRVFFPRKIKYHK